MDNHFIPIFYQKRWAGPDGRVWVYSRPHKKPIVKPKRPKRNGFHPDLYTAKGLDPAIASYLETQFFKITDDHGAQALAEIEAGSTIPMDTLIRSGWTRFILSLLHRSPEQIAKFLDVVTRYVLIVKPLSERDYRAGKFSSRAPTFEEFWTSVLPQIANIIWIELIQKVIDSPRVGAFFNGLDWRVITFHKSLTLLTGDRPIIMTNGMNKPDSHLAIPIGPRKLFIAAHDRQMATSLERQDADDLVIFINDRIARQAHRFCIGNNDTYLGFFAGRFGDKQPSSPVETIRMPTDEELRQRYVRGEGPDDRI